jgi:hypothetical protein
LFLKARGEAVNQLDKNLLLDELGLTLSNQQYGRIYCLSASGQQKQIISDDEKELSFVLGCKTGGFHASQILGHTRFFTGCHDG